MILMNDKPMIHKPHGTDCTAVELSNVESSEHVHDHIITSTSKHLYYRPTAGDDGFMTVQ